MICRSVRRSVQRIVENGGSDPDAVWHHRSDGSRDEVGVGFGPREGGTFGGEFGARNCNQMYSAATRPSSQIILGKLVITVTVIVIVFGPTVRIHLGLQVLN